MHSLDHERAAEMADELHQLMLKYGARLGVYAVLKALPAYWSLVVTADTSTEAVDRWRIINGYIEQNIRQVFGRVRWGS
jgi:hypothetical protein